MYIGFFSFDWHLYLARNIWQSFKGYSMKCHCLFLSKFFKPIGWCWNKNISSERRYSWILESIASKELFMWGQSDRTAVRHLPYMRPTQDIPSSHSVPRNYEERFLRAKTVITPKQTDTKTKNKQKLRKGTLHVAKHGSNPFIWYAPQPCPEYSQHHIETEVSPEHC